MVRAVMSAAEAVSRPAGSTTVAVCGVTRGSPGPSGSTVGVPVAGGHAGGGCGRGLPGQRGRALEPLLEVERDPLPAGGDVVLGSRPEIAHM